MKRGVSPCARFLCVAVGTIILLAWAQPAHANIWDLLEQLSGPGPFDARGPALLVSGGCLARLIDPNTQEFSGNKRPLLGLPHKLKPSTPCFYADIHFLHADASPDKKFFDVDATTHEFGVTFQIRQPIEIGAGLGWIHFESNGVSKNQFAGTPARLVLKPLLFVPKWQGQETKEWLGFLKYYVRMSVIKGLAGQDFGVSNQVFDERNKHNFLTSAGFVIDVLELIGGFK